MPRQTLHILLCILIVIVFILISWLTIRTKQPWHDEAWFACPAYNLIEYGHMGTTIKETAGIQWVRIDEHTYWQPPLHFLAQAGWYKIFGFSLFSMRFLSTFFGLILLFSIYSIATNLTGNRTAGLLAMGLTAIDFIFINAAADGRMDMMSAALAFASFASYLSLRKSNLPLAMLIGHTLVVMSGLTHPNGILALFGMILLNLYFDRRNLKFRHYLAALIPYIAGGIGWGLYIMKDPQAFQLQFGANLIGRIHDSFSVTTQFVREITDRYLYAYGITSAGSVTGRLKILILAGYITGVIGYVISVRVTGLKKARVLPWMLLLFFLTFAILFNQKQPRYLIYILPFYTMILGTWVCSAWGSSAKARIGLVILLAIMAIGQLGINIRRIGNDDYHRIYEPVIETLRDKIDGSTLVMGMPEIAFEFGYTPNILDDYTFGYFSGKEADIAIIDDEYRLLHSIINNHEPEIYSDISNRIETEFEEIYSNEQVTIYMRTPPS